MFLKITFLKSGDQAEKNEACLSFLEEIFTKSVHRGGVIELELHSNMHWQHLSAQYDELSYCFDGLPHESSSTLFASCKRISKLDELVWAETAIASYDIYFRTIPAADAE